MWRRSCCDWTHLNKAMWPLPKAPVGLVSIPVQTLSPGGLTGHGGGRGRVKVNQQRKELEEVCRYTVGSCLRMHEVKAMCEEAAAAWLVKDEGQRKASDGEIVMEGHNQLSEDSRTEGKGKDYRSFWEREDSEWENTAQEKMSVVPVLAKSPGCWDGTSCLEYHCIRLCRSCDHCSGHLFAQGIISWQWCGWHFKYHKSLVP